MKNKILAVHLTRMKWLADGAKTPAEIARRLRKFAEAWDRAAKMGAKIVSSEGDYICYTVPGHFGKILSDGLTSYCVCQEKRGKRIP